MSARSQPDNVPPDADLAIPFLERVLVHAPFPPIAIFLPRGFCADYQDGLELVVTAATTEGDIYVKNHEVKRHRFGLSPKYRPDDRVYLVMDMYDFRLPAAGTWRFQIKGFNWDKRDRKDIEVISVIPEEVTEAVTMEN